jgi:hypothetical protein
VAYLVAAYAVLWAISFGLVCSILIRQRKLEAELRALESVIDREPSRG